MVSINTNLSSLIAQNSLTSSTNKLNQAIERMATGHKINHASDNAANYSISTNMTTQLNAYNVASDNVSMGLDLVNTAQDILNVMSDNAARLHSLCIQARNGTYGADSLSAIQSEANSIISHLAMTYASAEYNNMSLFDLGDKLPDNLKTNGTLNGKSLEQCAAENNGFIAEVDEVTPYVIISDKTQLRSAITAAKSASAAAQKIVGIDNPDVLAELAKIVNGTDGYTANDCSGITICLTNDIDLSSVCASNTDSSGNGGWNPIGNSSKKFAGTFNGNGHKVSGLYIKRTSTDYQGLFGSATGTIKNVGVECEVTGGFFTGGLVGTTEGQVTNSYAMGDVTGTGNSIGGLAGCATVTNSYATCNVTGQRTNTGGLVGLTGAVSNCYAMGDVTGKENTGGLVGTAGGTVTNSYATGDVTATNSTGQRSNTGGLVGATDSTVSNSYATGDVTGTMHVGGLIGKMESQNIGNVYSLGLVTGENYFGSLVGTLSKGKVGATSDDFNIDIYNCLTRNQNMNVIGGAMESTYRTVYIDVSDKMEGWNSAVVQIETVTNIQVGINSDSSNQIGFETKFNYNLSAVSANIASDQSLSAINTFISQLSNKSTELGAISSRLESALDSIEVNINNLTSSRSTLRDADVAKVSSEYIRQQILQQASATLLSTANQSPSIALQLI